MSQICDLLVAEADAILADDYHAAFPFGECHCGCPLEDNGECPACIQQAIDEKAMAKWMEAHPDMVMDANR
jgi:hypothetical protein